MTDRRDIMHYSVTVTANWDDWSRYQFPDQRAFYELFDEGWMAATSLAWICNCSDEQVYDTLHDLEHLGYVTIGHREREWHGIATLDDIRKCRRR